MNKRKNILVILLLSILIIGVAPKTAQASTSTYTRIDYVYTSESEESFWQSTSWYKNGKPVGDPTGWYCRIQSQKLIRTHHENPRWVPSRNENVVQISREYSVTIQCRD